MAMIRKPYSVAGFFAREHGLSGLQALLTAKDFELTSVFTHRKKPRSEDPERGERDDFKNYESICKLHSIPLFAIDTKSENTKIFEVLEKDPPDLLAVISWRMLISKDILELPRFGGINLHRGELPRYKGGLPILRALEDGQDRICISAHLLTEEIDGGEVIEEVWHPVNYVQTQSLAANVERLKNEINPLFGPLMLRALRQIVSDE